MSTLLQHYQDIRISATYADGFTLLEGLKRNQPDVLILDIQMPGLGGDALVPMLLKEYPMLRILVLTHMEHEYYIKTLVNAGILGYVLKSSQEQVLMEGIRKVGLGRQFLDPVIKHYIDEVKEQATGSPFLTQRELEVLRLIAEDYNSNQIAERLFISKRTVDNHRINLLLKLGAKRSANLVKKAIELGLIV